VAYYRLLNTLGVNSLDPATIEIVMREIKRSEAKEKARLASRKTVKTYVKISRELTYNGVKLGENTASLEMRSKYDAIAADAQKQAQNTVKDKQL
jgi:hypothetical protein